MLFGTGLLPALFAGLDEKLCNVPERADVSWLPVPGDGTTGAPLFDALTGFVSLVATGVLALGAFATFGSFAAAFPDDVFAEAIVGTFVEALVEVVGVPAFTFSPFISPRFATTSVLASAPCFTFAAVFRFGFAVATSGPFAGAALGSEFTITVPPFGSLLATAIGGNTAPSEFFCPVAAALAGVELSVAGVAAFCATLDVSGAPDNPFRAT